MTNHCNIPNGGEVIVSEFIPPGGKHEGTIKGVQGVVIGRRDSSNGKLICICFRMAGGRTAHTREFPLCSLTPVVSKTG